MWYILICGIPCRILRTCSPFCDDQQVKDALTVTASP